MEIGMIVIILFIAYVIFKWLYAANIIFPSVEKNKNTTFSGQINEKILTDNELSFFNKL